MQIEPEYRRARPFLFGGEPGKSEGLELLICRHLPEFVEGERRRIAYAIETDEERSSRRMSDEAGDVIRAQHGLLEPGALGLLVCVEQLVPLGRQPRQHTVQRGLERPVPQDDHGARIVAAQLE